MSIVRRGQRIKNRPGYSLLRSNNGLGPPRWQRNYISREPLIPPIVRERTEINVRNIRQAYLFFSRTIERDDLLTFAEEQLPRAIGRFVSNTFPGDPIQRYCWGLIVREATWLGVVILRSRIEDSQVSIMSKIENRWIIEDQGFPIRLQQNQTIVLDYRQ